MLLDRRGRGSDDNLQVGKCPLRHELVLMLWTATRRDALIARRDHSYVAKPSA